MTNIFPLLIVETIISTNWVNFSGDIHIERGTNAIHQYQQVQTNTYKYKVEMVTNPIASMLIGESTNGIERWTSPSALPSLPNKQTKE